MSFFFALILFVGKLLIFFFSLFFLFFLFLLFLVFFFAYSLFIIVMFPLLPFVFFCFFFPFFSSFWSKLLPPLLATQLIPMMWHEHWRNSGQRKTICLRFFFFFWQLLANQKSRICSYIGWESLSTGHVHHLLSTCLFIIWWLDYMNSYRAILSFSNFSCLLQIISFSRPNETTLWHHSRTNHFHQSNLTTFHAHINSLSTHNKEIFIKIISIHVQILLWSYVINIIIIAITFRVNYSTDTSWKNYFPYQQHH